MRIKEILQKQGEIYKNLTSNKTVETCNETIKKPSPARLDLHFDTGHGTMILIEEFAAIKGLEKLLGKELLIAEHIVEQPGYGDFEIGIKDDYIIYLKISNLNLKKIPEQVNKLTNLQKLDLNNNKIKEIRNLDNLQNLKELDISYNQIKNKEKVKNLENNGIWVEI